MVSGAGDIFVVFFTIYDPRIHPDSPKAQRPLFKVEILLQHLLYNAKMCWDTGSILSIDEQKIGLQGRYVAKLRITYKRIGDGFQADTICEEGYTYTHSSSDIILYQTLGVIIFLPCISGVYG